MNHIAGFDGLFDMNLSHFFSGVVAVVSSQLSASSQTS